MYMLLAYCFSNVPGSHQSPTRLWKRCSIFTFLLTVFTQRALQSPGHFEATLWSPSQELRGGRNLRSHWTRTRTTPRNPFSSSHRSRNLQISTEEGPGPLMGRQLKMLDNCFFSWAEICPFTIPHLSSPWITLKKTSLDWALYSGPLPGWSPLK